MKKFIKLGKESVEVSEEVYKDYYKMEELIKAIKELTINFISDLVLFLFRRR